MQHRRYLPMAICAASLLACAAPDPLHAAESEGSGDGVLFPPATTVYPGTREFNWTVRVPVLAIEQREFVFKAPTGTTRPQRWDYEGPAVRTERRRIGTYPEFSCKYIDWTVSNECSTVWRGIYADLPVVVMRPQHAIFDVPDWRWKAQTLPVAVPRWTWKEERWTVGVPVIVTEPTDDQRGPRADGPPVSDELARVSSMLEAKQAAALGAFDEGLRAMDESIGTVEAREADPRRLESSDGNTMDMVATRATLREERAKAVLRFRQMRAELDAATQTREVR